MNRLPAAFKLPMPVIAAPMFLVSGPRLVIESCKAGIIGTFPALNHRTSEGFEEWLLQIKAELAGFEKSTGKRAAPFGVNLIVNEQLNARLAADLALTVKHKVPLVITSLGAVSSLVKAVQGYGGIVFHDVISVRHAQKAAEAGVDGLIPVCAGAGGHAGTMSPYALIPEIRKFFGGAIALSGAMSTGAHVASALAAGADFAYMGTRFIATQESLAPQEYKDMVVRSCATDVLYLKDISVAPANFLRESVVKAGLDPANIAPKSKEERTAANRMGTPGQQAPKAWKDVWSAGQGVGSVNDCPTVGELVCRMRGEYTEALDSLAARRAAAKL